MEFNLEWLYKIFTYSSIQVKFIATFIAILAFIIIRRIAHKIIQSQIKDTCLYCAVTNKKSVEKLFWCKAAIRDEI